ncbi:M1 family metallopeptidase [Flavihumibacter petaseus]|uniref:Peptidase M1 membrane alanine aminopeptidase domain-containing protein n=1 Tax=Flavihumibacter petaseus NBRC 106054 TaxID=1220578 RepID=A0A0E9MTI7_9BACT|nr:M1 family metallopeptidase [Flavihumibacter petaseus]GAO41077.1 hypothetical protein FPE01S_01_00890 [Flavihumibacter petaseus NBRC 106054]
MRSTLLQCLLFLLLVTVKESRSQEHTPVARWQQTADFTITAQLDDKEHGILGKETIRYSNNSPDTLYYIWFHVWPNAYKNDHTAFSEQLLLLNRQDFYFSNENQRGYINRLNFRINGSPAETEDHPIHQDIVRLQLQEPLYPKQSISIDVSFHVKLPYIFSRSGYRQGFYAVTQWFPKPAVYDTAGWHPMPYLDQGEFYQEFGNFDVTIECPAGFTLAATGHLVDSSSSAPRRFHYQLEQATDFAWFASKKFVVTTDSVQLPSGKKVNIRQYVFRNNAAKWNGSIEAIKTSLLQRSKWVGDYPYSDAVIVEGYQGPGIGGMEYPGLAVIREGLNAGERDITIDHELGHSWWYGAVSNNERDHPWMDEGINTFYDHRYQLRDEPGITRQFVSALETMHLDQPVTTPSDNFNKANYALMAYEKAGWFFENLEHQLGTPLFDSCMRTYYQNFRFVHPAPADLRQTFETISGRPLPQFERLNQQGSLDSNHRPVRLAFLYGRKTPERYRYIDIGPAPGYNHYDGFMIGAFLHNYQPPLSRFRFFVAPMYGTRSKTFTGIGDISYTGFLPGYWHQWKVGVTAARFSMQETENEGVRQSYAYEKVAPYLVYQLKEQPLSKRERTIQFKSFFFREYSPEYNTIIDGNDTSIAVTSQSSTRNLQQLQLRWADHRLLYPYDFQFQAEYQPEFTRLALTGNYFFNYHKKDQGFRLRFFAGKFFYNRGKTTFSELELDRYLLNTTGANGAEDYTYSGYFIGRNEYEGWQSQQIMMRDGGFKVRTDLLSDKVGKSDNWLFAINMTTDIPDKINPLTLLPFKMPLRLFADIGTFGEAWESTYSEQKVLFDAGIQVSLLRDLVTVYFPIVVAQPFRDYNKSVLGDNSFWRTVSFSISIGQFRMRPLLAQTGL